MSDEAKTEPKNEPKKKSKKDAPPKKNIIVDLFHEYRGEFRKIVWPSREELLKQTITVIIISLIFGAYIALLDGAFGSLFTVFVNTFIS